MTYASPELVVVGRAELVVLGSCIPGLNDHPGSFTKPPMGVALGYSD